MARLIRNIAVVLLLAAFTLPAIGYAVGMVRGANVSAAENRRLSAFPRWSEAETFRGYTDDIDANLRDNFGGRTTLIDIARNVRDNLGEDPPLVVRGEDDWLFLGQTGYREEFEGRGRWNDARVEGWVRDLRAAEAVFAERGIPFAAAIAPDKARIYSEHLPGDWTMGERRFATSLLRGMQGAGSDAFVSLDAAMLRAKAAGEQVYYRRDTHWSPSGSFAASQVWMDAMGGTRPRYDGGTVALRGRAALGDLDRMSGEEASTEPEAMMRADPNTPGYSVVFPHIAPNGDPERGALATKTIEADVDGARGTLVIVGDSFADFMMPQFMAGYERVVKIHHGSEAFTVGTDEILSYDPDAVLFLVVERDAARKARPILVGPSTDAGGQPLPLPSR